LRYFTVYGPWGRPDMSPYIFAKAIHAGNPISLYHLGFVKRDYSYIDDIVAGTLAVLDKPAPAHRVVNLGASRSEDIMHVIELFEKAIGKKAIIELKPGEPGDMQETSADITATTREFGWAPKVAVEDGIPKFVEWFRTYNRL
jgi:UDP-glucuronate 4-epimerase